MPKVIRGTAALAALIVGLVMPSIAWAGAPKKPAAQYVLVNHKAKCKTNYHRATIKVAKRERVKVHGKWKTETVKVREVGCVYVAPKVPVATVAAPAPSAPAPSAPSSNAPAAVTAPAVIPVRASIDPSYTQNPANPKDVTFSYSAGTTDGSLPDGTLTFTVFVHAAVAQAGGCTLNVGGSIVGGFCEVTVPAFGSYDLNTTYSGGANVSATAGTETVDIEPPTLAPETVLEQWGVTAPTNGVAVLANVTGTSATVEVDDANFEGATSVGVSDNLGDVCTASVTGTAANCSMAVTGTPSSFTVAYPGGVNMVATQTLSPWGVPQTQRVTYEWPAESVAVSSPTVTSQIANVSYNGGWLKNGNSTVQVFNPAPSDPLVMSSGETLRLMWATTGSLIADPYPIGYLDVAVTGPGGFTEINEGGFGSSDCSTLANFSSQAVGTCQFTFSGPGVYTITVMYVSQDLSYASVDGPSETVSVQ